MSRPEPLARALKAALAGLDLNQRLLESRAMALWPDIVGDVTAGKTRPLHVNRGTLVVLVASSAWANQLNLLKPRLLKSIEARVGAGVIHDLRWKTGALDDVAAETVAPTGAVGAKRQRTSNEPELEPEETERIERLSQSVEDPRLHESVKRLLAASARRRRRLRAAGWLACHRCGCLYDPEGEVTPGPLAQARLCPVCRLELAPVVAPVQDG